MRKDSKGRKTSGSRTRSSSNGVSFSLAVDDIEILTDATPMPLPSPHPASIQQSQSSVKPSVPELSIIFDENYPAVGQANQQRQPSLSPTKVRYNKLLTCVSKKLPLIFFCFLPQRRSMANKVHGTSPGIRSPLKNIKNLNPPNRGMPANEQHFGPMKPHANQYLQHAVPEYRGPVRNIPRHPNDYQPVRIQRRSHSASDCLRGSGGRSNVHMGLQRPVMPPSNTYHLQHRAEQVNGFEPPSLHYPYPQGPQKMIKAYPRAPNPAFTGNSMPQSYPYMSYQHNQLPVNPVGYHSNFTSGSNAPHPPTSNILSSQSVPLPVSSSYPTSNLPPTAQQPPHTQTSAVTQPIMPAPSDSQASPGWMKQLPPEAYQLLMQQDAQLKMLQAQIQKLLQIQEGNLKQAKDKEKPVSLTAEMSTSTGEIVQARSYLGEFQF